MSDAKFSDDELNVVYDASLEFGKNWLRPVAELAAQRLPGRSPEFYAAVAGVVEACRSEVEQHVAQEHRRLNGKWSRRDAAAVDAWMSGRFPWMNGRNRKRALSQGQYYAHHDGW